MRLVKRTTIVEPCIDLDERTGILAVEAEHRHGAPEQHAAHRCGHERPARPRRQAAAARAAAPAGSRRRGAGRYDDTSGRSVISAGGIDTCGCIGGGVHAPGHVGARRDGAACASAAGASPDFSMQAGEQERQVVRLHPHARRRAAQHESARAFARRLAKLPP